jgi:aspartate kinase
LSKIKIGGIIQKSPLTRFQLWGGMSATCLPAELLEALGKANINVEFIVQCAGQDHTNSLVVCVDQDDQDKTLNILNQVQSDLKIDAMEIDPNVTSIGIYGPDFRIKAGLAGSFLRALDSAGISIQAISTSLSTFTVLIPASQINKAVATIQEVFELP